MRGYKLTNRTPKFKNCIHEWRPLIKYKGFWTFYCVKCLLFTMKDIDHMMFNEWIKLIKKYRKKYHERL